MWRPAVFRFGMIAVLAVACSGGSKSGTGAGGDTTIGNRSALVSNEPDMTAAYWCSIRSGEFEYPAMPCVIRKVGGHFMLAKLAGSQRFRGVVKPQGEGFTFDGELYCPWGDCNIALRGVFAPIGDGRLRGTFNDNTMVVTMTRTQENSAWGGAGYGGDAYGGFGGGGYGGASYGHVNTMGGP